MAQFAGGQPRLTVRKSNGDKIMSTQRIDYTIADNAAAPRWVINQPGTSQDQEGNLDVIIHGTRGEYLTVDFFHTAAMSSHDSSADTVVIPVTYWYRDSVSGRILEDSRTLTISDRVTKSTSGTQTDSLRGVTEDRVNVALEDTPLLAFFPARPGENAYIQGYVQLIFDGA